MGVVVVDAHLAYAVYRPGHDQRREHPRGHGAEQCKHQSRYPVAGQAADDGAEDTALQAADGEVAADGGEGLLKGGTVAGK